MIDPGGVAVVTGAASGIGLALAQACAARGLSVVLADVEETPLAEAAGALSGDGARVRAVVADVSDAASMGSIADAAEELGPVTLLFNNAGVGTVGPPTWELQASDWDWVIGVNLRGVVNGLMAFLPGMIERDRGHVVNTASAAGLLTPRGMAPYVVSKHAIVALSESLHHELVAAGSRVGVTVLCPGVVATRMADNERNRPERFKLPGRLSETRAVRHGEAQEQMKHAVAAGRDPAEIAQMALHAVEAREFYVIPDAWITEAARERFDRIVSAVEPVDPS